MIYDKTRILRRVKLISRCLNLDANPFRIKFFAMMILINHLRTLFTGRRRGRGDIYPPRFGNHPNFFSYLLLPPPPLSSSDWTISEQRFIITFFHFWYVGVIYWEVLEEGGSSNMKISWCIPHLSPFHIKVVYYTVNYNYHITLLNCSEPYEC